MIKEKWHEEADDLMDQILDKKESINCLMEELGGLKYELSELLEKNNSEEYQNDIAKCKLISFIRESLIKDEVIMAISEVNKNLSNHINIEKLKKKSGVHFVSVRGME